jgi:hypothetical protein
MKALGAVTSRLRTGFVVAVVLTALGCVREADGFSTVFATRKVRWVLV